MRLLRWIASVIATLLLAFSLAAAGLWVCCLPVTTELLAKATSGSENPTTPFNQEELVEAALATRDYTVGGHNLEALYSMLLDINASMEHPTIDQATALESLGAALSESDAALPSPEDLASVFSDLGLDRVLDEDAISHLDDVNAVISSVGIAQIIAFVVLAACIVLLAVRGGIRWIGGVLFFGGSLVIVCFALVGLWALIDFNGLFTALHSTFFAQGNWTFDIDSLLITMYPTGFWIGMGIVWLVTTLLLSSVCVLVGAKLRK